MTGNLMARIVVPVANEEDAERDLLRESRVPVVALPDADQVA